MMAARGHPTPTAGGAGERRAPGSAAFSARWPSGGYTSPSPKAPSPRNWLPAGLSWAQTADGEVLRPPGLDPLEAPAEPGHGLGAGASSTASHSSQSASQRHAPSPGGVGGRSPQRRSSARISARMASSVSAWLMPKVDSEVANKHLRREEVGAAAGARDRRPAQRWRPHPCAAPWLPRRVGGRARGCRCRHSPRRR
jgi:hypothetical protein